MCYVIGKCIGKTTKVDTLVAHWQEDKRGFGCVDLIPTVGAVISFFHIFLSMIQVSTYLRCNAQSRML